MPPPATDPPAPFSEVRLWFAVSAGIAAVMLLGVAITALLIPADPYPSRGSLLLSDDPSPEKVQLVLARNLLVLAIHTLAAYVGAIIGREHKPLKGRARVFLPLHFKLPRWMERAALIYALCATTASVLIQTTGLGFVLRDIATVADTSPALLVLLCVPHALPELLGVFLPLGLFLIQARRGQLAPLGRWAWQAAGIALPVIAAASYIEVYFTPGVLARFA